MTLSSISSAAVPQPPAATLADPAAEKRPDGPPPPSSGDRARGNLSSLAAALGVDPDTLLNSDLPALLGQISATGYASTVKDSVDGGLAVDRYA